MTGRDTLTFVGVLILLGIVHYLLFGKIDGDDGTQIWVFAALVTIVRAVREERSA